MQAIWNVKLPMHVKHVRTTAVCVSLQWYGHVSHSAGLAETILKGTVKVGRLQGRPKKRYEDNIREWTGLEYALPRGQWRTEENGGNWL